MTFWLLKTSLIVTDLVQKIFPAKVFAVGGSDEGLQLPNPLGCENLQCAVETIWKALYYLSYPIVTLFIILGAFRILTAGGNQEKVKSGKNMLLYAILGFTIILVAGGLGKLIIDLLTPSTT